MIPSKRRLFLCLEQPVAFGFAQRSIVQRGDDFVAVYNLKHILEIKDASAINHSFAFHSEQHKKRGQVPNRANFAVQTKASVPPTPGLLFVKGSRGAHLGERGKPDGGQRRRHLPAALHLFR